MKRTQLSDETLEELEKAKKFYKHIEESMGRDDVRTFAHRHDNYKMNVDLIIRKALKAFNEDRNKAL